MCSSLHLQIIETVYEKNIRKIALFALNNIYCEDHRMETQKATISHSGYFLERHKELNNNNRKKTVAVDGYIHLSFVVLLLFQIPNKRAEYEVLK